jgi:hypothetical protein
MPAHVIGDRNVIHEFETSPLLVSAHRDYLRSLYHPLPSSLDGSRARRETLGRLLIRAGQWIQGCRPEAVQPAPLGTSSGPV